MRPSIRLAIQASEFETVRVALSESTVPKQSFALLGQPQTNFKAHQKPAHVGKVKRKTSNA